MRMRVSVFTLLREHVREGQGMMLPGEKEDIKEERYVNIDVRLQILRSEFRAP